ncbi:hypothetical protein ACQ4M4_03545 [Leptolyngbya sp. AN02str]|uniref:hypothetical protein n=1 Tax=Leptolyngbya sp. AN02str TaxID=3423363 RepID=UPI003D318334
MKDFVLDAPAANRYTYFVAHYGNNYQMQTAVLSIQHDFNASIRDLHIQIRQRINDILGEETPSCYHILALAAPKPVPVGSNSSSNLSD